MRYLTLAEALTIAEAVTGLDFVTLAKASRLKLLDSAFHGPQAVGLVGPTDSTTRHASWRR